MMQRLRKRHAHHSGGRDHAVDTRELHHLDDGAHAAPLLADPPREGLHELDFGRGIRAIAELVLEPLQAQRVDRAVGPEARHEEAGQPARRLRQHQEGVAHRRRHEPFVPGDGVGLARRHRGRGIGAHVRAALFLGHAHAERDRVLFPPRPEACVVSARCDLADQFAQDRRLDRECADAGARHRDRAHVSVLDLRHHEVARRARDLGRRSRARSIGGPGRGVQASLHALGHEAVIGGMEFDRVAAEALGVENLELRDVLVGQPRRFEHRGAPQRRPKSESAASSAAAPFAATASRRARSLVNRSTSSKGGD